MQDQFLITINNPVIKNHKVYGQEILPGLAYIDMLYQYFREKGHDYTRLELRNLSIHHPLIVGQDYQILLSMQCSEIKAGQWQIRVEGQEQHGRILQPEKKLYVTAEMQVTDPVVFDETLDLVTMKQSALRSSGLDEVYRKYRGRDLVHTGFIKAEGIIYGFEAAILIELSLGQAALPSAGDFMFHPTLIDASGVGSWGLFESLAEGEERVFIPLFYESFRAAALLQEKCITRVRTSSVYRKNDLLYMTIEYFDPSGIKVGELKNFATKLVREAGLVNPNRKKTPKPGKGKPALTDSNQPIDHPKAAGTPATGIETFLRKILADKLKRSVEQIDPRAGYFEMGLDSSVLLEIVQAVSTFIKTPLSPTLLFEYTTVAELAGYLSQAYSDRFQQVPIFGSKPTHVPVKVDFGPPSENPVLLPGAMLPEIQGDIAIIGIAGRYPGAGNLREFWTNLKEGKDLIREIPKSRWDYHRFDGLKSPSGKSMSKWGGFIDDPDCFDPHFFRISPREAELIDPQERLFLETCWEAIEDAGYAPHSLVGPRGLNKRQDVGVFVGVMHKDYTLVGAEALSREQVFPLSLHCSEIANRVSYFCNFHGPSMAVDTACSSSLTAVHLAIESIRHGECEAALAGGVNLSLHPDKYLTIGMLDMYSSDGYCHTFGKGGDGYVTGEGIGAVLLKPLSRAIQDQDHIYAVIKGSAINHVGTVSGITVPSPVAQADLIANCLEKTGIHPRTISYLEAHGTGTSLGDPIEMQGLVKAFRQYTSDAQFCSIGSVKSNIGHGESAAGISGLHKVILQLYYKTLVPSLHAEELNPYLDFIQSPFYIQNQAEEWKQPVLLENGREVSYPRRAGLSSFGASGSNAHLILEEYLPQATPEPAASNFMTHDQPALIPLSAKNEERLQAYARRLLEFLKAPGQGKINLAELAFTLQVGREAMETRVAFLVKEIPELIAKLEALGEGRETIENCWRGQVKYRKEPMAFFSPEQDPLELIQQWIASGDFKNIAELWVKGYGMDWALFYGAITPRRISLPAYPFAKERYWVPQADAKSGSSLTSPAMACAIHPLLHQNISNFAEQRFCSTFTGREFFLSDHVVRGQRVLPGVAYLEMVRAAVEQAAGDLAPDRTGIILKNVAWVQPIVVADQPLQVQIALFPEDNGEIAYEIYTLSPNNTPEPVVGHSQGCAALGPIPKVPSLDLPALQARCTQNPLSSAQCYELFQTMGIHYGSAHQGIEQLYPGPDQVLAKLTLPAAITDSLDQFILHPSLMDSALQATLGFMIGDPKPVLPFALEELKIIGKCSAAMWVLVRYAEGSRAGDRVEKFDLDLSDETGTICVQIKGFSTRVMEGIQANQVSQAVSSAVSPGPPVGKIRLTPVWDVVLPESGQTYPLPTDQVVMVGGTDHLRNEIRKQYPQALVLEIQRGDTIETIAKKMEALGSIDHLWWVAPAHSLGSITGEAIIKEQDQGVLQVFRLIKAMLRLGYGTRELGWSVFTTQAQPIVKNEVVNPTHASIHGLIGSLAKEYPNWKLRLIDLEAGENMPLADILMLPADRAGQPWVHRGHQWYRRQLIPVQCAPLEQSLYQKEGVYLVIGGAGDLGEIWSEYLLRTYQAQVVWIGRRQKDGTIRAKLDRLAALGPAPLYIAADATDRKALGQACKEIKKRYGKINGVIHAAMALSDQSLAMMDEGQFKTALLAKVEVSVRLAQVFQKEPLDFVLFFSSLISFIKNPVQSNYASGCTFMDAFAHQLAREWPGTVKVINWGYWLKEETADLKSYQVYQRLAEIGMGAIEPPEAMETLEILLAGPIDQIAFFKTTQPLVVEGMNLEEMMVADGAGVVRRRRSPAFECRVTDTGQKPETTRTGGITPDLLREKTTVYLKNLVGATLKIPGQKINPAAPLEIYGIDSIVVVQLTNALRQVLADVSTTLFFEYQTIDALVEHFLKTKKDSLPTLLGLAAETPGTGAAVDGAGEEFTPPPTGSSHLTLRKSGRFAQWRDPEFVGTDSPLSRVREVAIIGLAGRYAGADNVLEFWNNLKEGKNCITEIPKERWDWRRYFHEEKGRKGSIYTKWGGFLKEIDKFDPLFFQIAPKEAEKMDPQERLFLETAYQVMEDAGYTPANLSESRKIGVFAGVMYGYYPTGAKYWSIANRISYLFNFQGPSVTMDTACSSSITAIHFALESLYSGVCECAIAGGVNLIVAPKHYLGLSEMTMLSPGDQCRSFGDQADGFVDGEGVGAVLLKPLSKAVADGDHIYGVIKGSMLNAGGKTHGYTVPNPNAQFRLIADALQRARVNARTISYLEAHGTGTALGDPIEIAGLTRAFEQDTPDKQFCAIGSAKSNIGHCESAAGIAAVTKVLMQFKHGQLAPSLHSTVPNPNIDFHNTPFVVQQSLAEWKRPVVEIDGQSREYPRRAGISSFGAGGSNAHLIIEEYIPQGEERASMAITTQKPALIVLSARNEERLTELVRQLLGAIREPQLKEASLAEIAYTLQVGREAKEERLGLIVGTIGELEEKLQGFVDGREGIPELYRGQAKSNNESLAVFAADEDLAKTVDIWITKGKYTKLLDLWVKGLTIDWNRFYGNAKPRRISLPTYPFARESYWISRSETEAVGNSPASAMIAPIHPLLQQNTSDLAEQRFSSTFTGQEFFLADHIIKDQPLLPGVVYLEMARAAVDQATGSLKEAGTGIRLKNIVWAKPIIVKDHPVQVHIALFPQDNGEIAYEIYSHSEPTPVGHSHGCAVLNVFDNNHTLNLESLQTECTQTTLTPDQCYQAFRSMGINYGPAHRGIEQIHIGPTQILAKLSLPSTVLNTHDQFILHPSIMDAALQAVIGFKIGSGDLKPALPFALEELEIFGQCPATIWALLRYSQGSHAGDQVERFDIDMCDDQGTVWVRMKGFSLRVWEGEAGPGGAAAIRGTLMLHPAWFEQTTIPTEATPDYTRHLIFLCEPGEVSGASVEEQMKGASCFCLQSEQTGIDRRFQAYAARVFKEIQSILQAKPEGQVLLQVVVANRGESQLCSGLYGLLQTAHLENPKLNGQLIEVEPGENEAGIVAKLKENSHSPGDGRVRYQDGKRYLAGWDEIEVSQEPVAIPWKDRGVYLITGGAGGLGLIFATEIARQVKGAALILTGRSPLTPEKQAGLKELQSLGVRVAYQPVDVTDLKAVTGLIQSIRDDFGSLNGIIHSAGVIQDSFIIKKTKEKLLEVLAPKVSGLVNLDLASQDLPLDFMILFSSIAGSLGNPGQADYSAANAFMDAYATYRNNLVAAKQRRGRIISINWPLWKEGGLGVAEETERMMTESTGMTTIETPAAIRAFYQGFASGKDQVMVIEGDLPRIKQMVSAALTRVAVKEIKALPAVDQDLLREKAANYFKKLLASVIKLPTNQIEASAPLEKYGIDSIMVMQLTNQLEKTFGSLPKTLFFEYQNIQSLTGYFLESYPDQLAAALGVEAKGAATAGNSNVSVAAAEPVRTAFSSRGRSRFASGRIESQGEKGALDIAVIGVSGRYPGAGDIREFWKNLQSGRDCITEIPKDRWDYNLDYDEDRNKPGKTNSKWGGFLEGVDWFDPLFFNISPREAEIMDPQERLFLECVYATLEDAGYTRETLSWQQGFGLEGNVGVFVGVMYEEYQLYGAQAQILGRPVALGGNLASIANRVSYFCNFHGPSLAVDTMCSSSLTALHLACHHLQLGECGLAIAGGVNVSIHPNKYLVLGQGKFASSKGRCESFGQGGDGYVPGEGVGAVLLKPLSQAMVDGDQIYGIIKGTAINHDGKTNGFTVPNPNAQSSVIGRALKAGGIDPRTISYLEAHGTGTSLGDPIEIAGLTRTFREYTSDQQFCAIGSAKSNIGHCESAAGIAGLTKVLLQLKFGQLVPSLHSSVLNPNIDFSQTPFIVQQTLAEWKRPVVESGGAIREYPRRAGISSFGAGGSNAHVVIEEYIPKGRERDPIAITVRNPAIIVLSARNEDRLKEQAQQLLGAIKEQQFTESDLADIAYTLQVGREAMEERLAMIVGSIKELEDKLQGFLEDEDGVPDLYRGQTKRNKDTLAILTVDEDLQKGIDTWIAKGKYERLLDLWVKGLTIDWNKLYGVTKPRRISLPTYPFAKESYWAVKSPKKPIGSSSTVTSVLAGSIHPLLHQNTSDFFEQRFTSTFTGQEFFLADHVLKGQRVLSGVACLEMARAAVEQAARVNEKSRTWIQLKNVVWLRPVTAGDHPAQIHIGLCLEENDKITYEIYSESKADDLERLIHCQGNAALVNDAGVPTLDLRVLQGQCCQNIFSAAEVYQTFKAMGIAYGPGHRGIEKIYVGSGQVLAKLSLPSSVANTENQFILHPSLMDAALQASIGFTIGGNDLKPVLPFALRELEIFGKCTSTMWALVRYSDSSGISDQVKKLDIDLCDDQGIICARLKGLSAREPEEEIATDCSLSGAVIEPGISTTLLVPVWDIVPKEPGQTSPSTTDRVVIIGELQGELIAIREQYPNARVLDIQPDDNIEVFVQELTDIGLINHIIWIAPDNPLKSLADEVLIEEQNRGVLKAFRGIKALLRLGYGFNNLAWTVITIQAQPINKNDRVNPTHAGLQGLFGSLAKEYPNWKIRHLDLEAGGEWPMADIFTKPFDSQGELLVYRGRKWYRRHLIPFQCPLPDRTAYQTGGVYVVVGGAGGIGEAWSEYMINTYQARIVWIGRRQKDPAIQAKLDAMAALGPTPLYISADATGRKSLQKAYEEIKKHYSKINGVVHSAIVLQDQSLVNMNEEQFRSVLAAKVDVSVRIAQVFNNEPLDFIMFFSSVNSFFKAPGQSNYAAGCTFKDAFASQLAHEWPCAVKIINWGYWGSVGVVASKAYQDRMAQAGIVSIEPQEAMEALEILLAGPVDQIALLKTTEAVN
jgi:polyketide synthase PksN